MGRFITINPSKKIEFELRDVKRKFEQLNSKTKDLELIEKMKFLETEIFKISQETITLAYNISKIYFEPYNRQPFINRIALLQDFYNKSL